MIDATVGALSERPVQQALDDASAGDGPETRVERFVRALHHVTPEVERLGRSLVRLTVDAPRSDAKGMPRRGYRRIEWIESALAPWRNQLRPAKWQRLVCALAMVVGWEALIAQRDVCGLSAAEGEELSVWVARAIVRAALSEETGRAAGR